jgi:hypothetical protein
VAAPVSVTSIRPLPAWEMSDLEKETDMETILLWLVVALVGGLLGMLAAYRTLPRHWTGWIVAAGRA